ncbi:fibrous sheath-interacting 1 isoform X2 [Labeo rohita]|uniref:Fibrous sheath-interacting 1 isoform X2 n=1 Tax=Labeo rohita TaxID=84645 RepID=A0A498P634_LABRO|nr:fibrous sheath-interacting 1 isoform X2 [Labeo rohita]
MEDQPADGRQRGAARSKRRQDFVKRNIEVLLEVEIDGGRGEEAISAQETGRDRHSGSLIGSCQGRDLPVRAGGRRANGATFIRAGGSGSLSL